MNGYVILNPAFLQLSFNTGHFLTLLNFLVNVLLITYQLIPAYSLLNHSPRNKPLRGLQVFFTMMNVMHENLHLHFWYFFRIDS